MSYDAPLLSAWSGGSALWPSIRLAGCVIKDDQDRVLLLHRNTPKRKHWEIPGGKLDPGEDESETATRELREETGVEVNLERELGKGIFVQDGYIMVYTWFLATIASGTPRVRERNIHDRCEFLKIADLKAMTDELSPNARNFVEELDGGRINI
ncbi:NUDIX hydrolase [Actinophytocola sp.]|uniref:NUDIX hydrolase n=1 Tax=Actinophytocola sp. TaxID=1872138 RepID=UPI002D26BCF1|nr:NUDIX hydrolase [Actinophytocola sp.]HYQ67808.1 NUDIX hydrolase [Actinophytocola sp.]